MPTWRKHCEWMCAGGMISYSDYFQKCCYDIHTRTFVEWKKRLFKIGFNHLIFSMYVCFCYAYIENIKTLTLLCCNISFCINCSKFAKKSFSSKYLLSVFTEKNEINCFKAYLRPRIKLPSSMIIRYYNNE